MSNVIKSLNPATLDYIGETNAIEPENIPVIIERAKVAQKLWKKTSAKQRIQLLERLLHYLSENMDSVAKIIHKETGKPRLETINSDVIAGMSTLRYTIDVLEDILKPRKIKLKGMRIAMKYMGRSSYIYPKPVGIVGIISPWNFPFGIPFSQTVQALAVGNAVILKPSSETVLTGLKIQEIYEDTGFPQNIIQVIPGSGSTTGSALVQSSIDRIIFTGSVAVGKKIMEMASQRLTPITLELGGKSPMIVFKDADLRRTVKGALWGSFVNAGQMCAGIKRIYIHEDIYDEFVHLFKEETQKLKQGYDWDDPTISLGPMINKGALEDMKAHVKRALEQGARVILGGKELMGKKGHFFEPTIIVNAKQEYDVVQEEIFGPIVPILKFTTEKEAVQLANDLKFGLYGSVWTTDIEKGKRVANKLHQGTIAINNHAYTYGIPHLPWGGNGKSGFGRTHGKFGFEELLEPHHVHIDEGKIVSELWWQPYTKDKLDAQKEMSDLLFLKKYRKLFSLFKRFRTTEK